MPGSAVLRVEPRAVRRGVAECSIDDSISGNTEYQFSHVNSRRQPRLSQKPIVGGVVQLKNAVECFFISRQAGEHRSAPIGKLSRDKTVGVALIYFARAWQHYLPPRRLSSKRRTEIMP